MKTSLMAKMVVFGFALTISFMLGLSDAGAQIPGIPPCFSLECNCIEPSSCSGALTFSAEIENCDTLDIFVATDLEINGVPSSSGGTALNPGGIANPSLSITLPPEDYYYYWSVEVTRADGTIVDGWCDGVCSVPPCAIEVPVDIKPMSCPNPLNVKDRGVLSVAILGTDNLDVTQIDPASIELTGVSPLRWSWEDVATPAENGCNEYEGDGYLDLVFKFDAQDVIAALGVVDDGQEIPLSLTGSLMDEFGGTPIMGEDAVVIVKKGK